MTTLTVITVLMLTGIVKVQEAKEKQESAIQKFIQDSLFQENLEKEVNAAAKKQSGK